MSCSLCDTKAHWLINSSWVELGYSQAKSDMSTTSFTLRLMEIDNSCCAGRQLNTVSGNCLSCCSPTIETDTSKKIYKQMVKENQKMLCCYQQIKEKKMFFKIFLNFSTFQSMSRLNLLCYFSSYELSFLYWTMLWVCTIMMDPNTPETEHSVTQGTSSSPDCF